MRVRVLGASFVWGILSIILSPCHLASIPLIVGFISEQGQVTTRRAFWTSTLFAVGILVTIAVIGGITAAAGRMMGDVGRWGNCFVAAIFFLVGLHLVGVIPMPWSGPGQVKRKGLLAAFLLGLIFGIALGPCTFAYMAPVLAVAFKSGATSPVFAAALFTAFGVGHCAVITAAGQFDAAIGDTEQEQARGIGVAGSNGVSQPRQRSAPLAHSGRQFFPYQNDRIPKQDSLRWLRRRGGMHAADFVQAHQSAGEERHASATAAPASINIRAGA